MQPRRSARGSLHAAGAKPANRLPSGRQILRGDNCESQPATPAAAAGRSRDEEMGEPPFRSPPCWTVSYARRTRSGRRDSPRTATRDFCNAPPQEAEFGLDVRELEGALVLGSASSLGPGAGAGRLVSSGSTGSRPGRADRPERARPERRPSRRRRSRGSAPRPPTVSARRARRRVRRSRPVSRLLQVEGRDAAWIRYTPRPRSARARSSASRPRLIFAVSQRERSWAASSTSSPRRT